MGVAGNPAVTRLATRHGLSLGARRFVAGETLEEGIAAVRALRARGMLATLDFLGEKVAGLADAAEAASMYRRMVQALASAGLEPNVSLKLSQFGLTIDRATCAQNARGVVEAAAQVGGFVRIDMEESALVDATLDVYRTLARQFPGRVGIVLQAYLYRTRQDLESLLPVGLNVRLCKGAYSEPSSVAFPKKRDVDESFLRLLRTSLAQARFTAVATHDERIIRAALELSRELHAEGRYEFQMLYGVKPRLAQRLVAEGHRLRIYVPFGTHWYPYFIRRLAERPANLAFVVRGLWS
ncbi:MAG: proline dehydrogenase family protein [Limnochordaceae bacterium]|nr:proline dehydrogenase family protein [Limnochordaceae bacterium]